MENLHAWLAEGSSRFWPWVANHLWQSTLFVLALAPAVLVLRRAPARLRYSVSLLASLKFFLPSAIFFLLLARVAPAVEGWLPAAPLFSFDLGGMLARWRPAAGSGLGAPGHSELYCALTVIWLAGACGLAALWWSRHRAFARTFAAGRRAESGPEAQLLERVRLRLGLRRRVQLVLMPAPAEPGVWRTWRPVLVLPEEMPRHLAEEELEAIFLHELLHVRRWDNLVASLHMALCCLFWFHPLVWLLDRRLLAEREEACDERVLELAGGADTYLRGLLKSLRFGMGWRLAGISSAAGASNFQRRIQRIRGGSERARPSLLQRSLLGAGVVLFLAFSLAAGPGIGQPPAAQGPALRVEQGERPCPKKLQARGTDRQGGIELPSSEVPSPAAGAPPREKCSGEAGDRWASRRRSGEEPATSPRPAPPPPAAGAPTSTR